MASSRQLSVLIVLSKGTGNSLRASKKFLASYAFLPYFLFYNRGANLQKTQICESALEILAMQWPAVPASAIPN